MNLYPVIMCGGAGTRLWPSSRPARPKQFIPLAGNRSLFQDTVERVAPLAGETGRLIIVAGIVHRQWLLDQLAELDMDQPVQILLEPEARDSAAAMAAAALWTLNHDPSGVNVFVASDHHIPDHEAFREAALRAAKASVDGRIVTLGVKPSYPSTAYGYISPDADGLSVVKAFHEKPDVESAAEYIAAGYLWNSGNFIAPAQTLIEEMQARAPAVEMAARKSLGQGSGSVLVLGDPFRNAPKISVDYAVMEDTQRALVLSVDFAWSDLGAWDAIEATGKGEYGQHILEDSEGCLVRAPEGVLVGVLGVSDLAIIAEKDAILVCDLKRAQDVKKLVERVRTGYPQHLDFERPNLDTLGKGARRFADWLRCSALPLWSSLGQNSFGAFAEMISHECRPVLSSRRARVQARQIWTYAEAGRLGWEGPWRRVVESGVEHFRKDYLREDGLCRTLLAANGTPLDETALVYDQAFVLLALQAASRVIPKPQAAEQLALEIRAILLEQELPHGGFRESDDQPYQSNCHMHLLEACMAWEEHGGDQLWGKLADRIVRLCLNKFIDANNGFIREYFNEDWTPASSEEGRLVVPGHQFEWAWLLTRYGHHRGDEKALEAARRLYDFGLRGVDERSRVVFDAMSDHGRIRGQRARLWPQTEWLKAALILAEHSSDGPQRKYLEDAAQALRALSLYLLPQGIWHDKRLMTGKFIDEAAPASSFYHIMGAFAQMAALSPDDLGLTEGTLNLA